jgi:hypothetical protein
MIPVALKPCLCIWIEVNELVREAMTVTSAPELPPRMGRVRQLEGDGDEAVEVPGRTDHCDPART